MHIFSRNIVPPTFLAVKSVIEEETQDAVELFIMAGQEEAAWWHIISQGSGYGNDTLRRPILSLYTRLKVFYSSKHFIEASSNEETTGYSSNIARPANEILMKRRAFITSLWDSSCYCFRSVKSKAFAYASGEGLVPWGDRLLAFSRVRYDFNVRVDGSSSPIKFVTILAAWWPVFRWNVCFCRGSFWRHFDRYQKTYWHTPVNNYLTLPGFLRLSSATSVDLSSDAAFWRIRSTSSVSCRLESVDSTPLRRPVTAGDSFNLLCLILRNQWT